MQSILGNTRKTDLTFHSNGRIDLSAHVVKSLDLKKGDVIDVMVSDDGSEYCLYAKFRAPVVGRHEASCFPSHAGSRHFRAWSLRLCKALMAVAGSDACKVELGVGAVVELRNGETALPIIYKNIFNNATGSQI